MIRRILSALVLLVSVIAVTGCGKQCSSCGSPTGPSAPPTFHSTKSFTTADVDVKVVCGDGTVLTVKVHGTATAAGSGTTQAEADADALKNAIDAANIDLQVQLKVDINVVCATHTPPAPTPTPAPVPTPTPVPVPTPTPAPVCTYAVDTTPVNFPYQGGNGGVSVGTQPGCTWTAVSTSWINITSGSSGNVTGTTSYSVPLNPGSQRSGIITVTTLTGVRVKSITQDGAPPVPTPTPAPTPAPTPTPTPAPACTYAVDTTPLTMSYVGENGSISIGTQAGCTWTGSVGATWLEGSPLSGVGNNSKIGLYAGPNPGPQRTTTVTVRDQNGATYTKTVTQLGRPGA